MSLSETINDGSFGVSDAKAEVVAHRHLDPAKAEVPRCKDVDARGWVVDARAVGPCRNGQVHPGRGFVAQIPMGESGAQTDHALGGAGADHHEVDLIDPSRLLQLEESAGHLDEEARVACLIEITPRDPVPDGVSGPKDGSEGPEPVDDRRIGRHAYETLLRQGLALKIFIPAGAARAYCSGRLGWTCRHSFSVETSRSAHPVSSVALRAPCPSTPRHDGQLDGHCGIELRNATL